MCSAVRFSNARGSEVAFYCVFKNISKKLDVRKMRGGIESAYDQGCRNSFLTVKQLVRCGTGEEGVVFLDLICSTQHSVCV